MFHYSIKTGKKAICRAIKKPCKYQDVTFHSSNEAYMDEYVDLKNRIKANRGNKEQLEGKINSLVKRSNFEESLKDNLYNREITEEERGFLIDYSFKDKEKVKMLYNINDRQRREEFKKGNDFYFAENLKNMNKPFIYTTNDIRVFVKDNLREVKSIIRSEDIELYEELKKKKFPLGETAEGFMLCSSVYTSRDKNNWVVIKDKEDSNLLKKKEKLFKIINEEEANYELTEDDKDILIEEIIDNDKLKLVNQDLTFRDMIDEYKKGNDLPFAKALNRDEKWYIVGIKEENLDDFVKYNDTDILDDIKEEDPYNYEYFKDFKDYDRLKQAFKDNEKTHYLEKEKTWIYIY